MGEAEDFPPGAFTGLDLSEDLEISRRPEKSTAEHHQV
jgi:hypothetical protein